MPAADSLDDDGQQPRCPVCLEDLDGLAVVPLPCGHELCVACTSTLICVPSLFKSQQSHNRGNMIQASWAGTCFTCREPFDRGAMKRKLGELRRAS